MNRVIKFRAWNPQGDMLAPFEMGDGTTNEKLIYQEKFPLMQYTGLHDKNGKEIYEGDVVQYDFLPEGGDQRAEVVYEGRSFCLKNGGNSYLPYPERMEVIGNIYENPELLQTPSTEE